MVLTAAYLQGRGVSPVHDHRPGNEASVSHNLQRQRDGTPRLDWQGAGDGTEGRRRRNGWREELREGIGTVGGGWEVEEERNWLYRKRAMKWRE